MAAPKLLFKSPHHVILRAHFSHGLLRAEFAVNAAAVLKQGLGGWVRDFVVVGQVGAVVGSKDVCSWGEWAMVWCWGVAVGVEACGASVGGVAAGGVVVAGFGR